MHLAGKKTSTTARGWLNNSVQTEPKNHHYSLEDSKSGKPVRSVAGCDLGLNPHYQNSWSNLHA